jgi:hypothetical protein
MNKIFAGRIEHQKLQLQNPDDFKALIVSLDGKDIELTLGKKKENRTLNQNDLMWAINTLIANELGWEKEDLHEFFKEKFSPKKKITVKGIETIIPKGTSQFTKEEFSEYIERIKRFAAIELGIVIPENNEIVL